MQGTTPELKFHVVRAGAGAGKTRGLVEKVVEVFRLYQAAGAVPRLVVVALATCGKVHRFLPQSR